MSTVLPGLDFSSGGVSGQSAQTNFTPPANNSGGTAVVGQTVSSPYYNPGTVINSSTGQPVANVSRVTNPNVPAPQNSGGGSSGGGQAGPSSGPHAGDPHYNPSGAWDDNYYANFVNAGKSDAQRQLEAQQAQIRSGISSAYNPIFAELDRQLGTLPQQQADLSGQVNTVADQNKADVNATNDSQIAALENQKGDETNQYGQAVHGLQDNVKNLLQGASFYLGSLGSGDSSAAEGASAGIINNADKTQGQITNTYNQALTHIGQAQTAVRSVTAKNLMDIDNYKQQQLFSVSQWATDRINSLNSAKADASKEEQLAINQLILGTQQQYQARLQQLDDAVFNYRSAVDQWHSRMQDMLSLQEQAQQSAGKYSSTSQPTYQTLLTTNQQTGQQTPIIYNKNNPGDFYSVNTAGNQAAPTSGGQSSNILSGLHDLIFGNQANQGSQLPTDQSQQLVTPGPGVQYDQYGNPLN